MTAPAASPPETPHRPRELHGHRLGGLALAALGVVYGDIGTSPFYAIKESFGGVYGLAVTPPSVLGMVVELGAQIEV
jgi:KUP system potassium uptake protein